MEIITSLGIAAVIWIGGNDVMQGRMSAPEFFSFITAMVLVYTPIKRLINAYNAMQRSLGAAERVFEIIDEKPEIVDRPDAVELERVSGNVALQEVSFRYNDDYVLKNVNLEARKGEVVAFVGPSGGGKRPWSP